MWEKNLHDSLYLFVLTATEMANQPLSVTGLDNYTLWTQNVADTTEVRADSVPSDLFISRSVRYSCIRRSQNLPVKCLRNKIDLPTDKFRGREELLETIHNKLQNLPPSADLARRTVALVGPQGIGKSELSRQFAWEYSELIRTQSGLKRKPEKAYKIAFKSWPKTSESKCPKPRA